MDNDTLRRWKATLWKEYWEYIAVLVWDTLNSLAFEILSEMKDSVLSVKLSNLLSKSVSFYWMLWWQVDDMYFEKNPEKMTIWDLSKLHNKKTWALIKASIQWWILVSGNLKFLHKFSAFWEKLGLAFQIKDDLLDVEWNAKQTGKSVWGSEEKWFVFFMWLTETKKYLNELTSDCFKYLEILKSSKLQFLVSYIKDRVK
jgi:geranylgeranyl diphosphate synthase type II